jgi:hypothetical protein
VTVVDPIGKLEPLAKLVDIEGFEQLSVAVGAVQFAVTLAPVVVKLIFWGQLANVGGVTSLAHGSTTICVTLTLKVHVERLLRASVAVYVTVVVPIGKVAPLKKLLDMVGVEQLSLAVGAVQKACALIPDVVKLIFVGQFENVGAVKSLAHGSTTICVTFTLKVHVELLFRASIAV